jgi:phosphoribosylformylglycinamidine synthase
MAEACVALGTPVTGGNVSFYNENPSGAVYPTPVIGMVGLIDSLEHVTRATFRNAGDSIVLLGAPTAELGASEYLARIHGVVAGAPPACDPAFERRVIDALLETIRAGYASSAHDCSDGGMAVALAECVMADREQLFGAEIDLSFWGSLPLRTLLFGEAQGRIIISTPEPAAVLAIAKKAGIPGATIGTVRDASRGLTIKIGKDTFKASVDRLADFYHEAIPRIMSSSGAAAVQAPALAQT